MRVAKTAVNFLDWVNRKLERLEIGTKELPKIVFVHIPKSGGSSVNNAFRKVYTPSYYRVMSNSYEVANKYFKTQRFLDFKHYQIGRGLLLFEAATSGKKYLTGHVYINREMKSELVDMGYKFITIVRDPIDRCFSNYFYNYYKHSDHFAVSTTFENYINNYPDIGYKYVQYYGGLRRDGDYKSEEAINEAFENLKQYDIVGRLKKMDEFTSKIKHDLGIEIKIPKINKNPADKKRYNKFKQNENYRDMLRNICEPDLKLFDLLNSEKM